MSYDETLERCLRAYKVLTEGRSRFTGFSWPLPTDEEPGDWVHASGPLRLCANGVHACTVGQLAQWLGEELWSIELDGEILRCEPALVAARGRLLAPVAAWDQPARRAFAQACLDRVRPVAADVAGGDVLLAAIEQLAAGGRAGPAGYWAAVLCGQAAAGRRAGAEYDAAFARERDAQASWLGAELGLLT